jgi:hypothetical protein
MIEVAAAADVGTVVALVTISFVSFLCGTVFRLWPEKIQEYAELLDGSLLFLAPARHRAVIARCSLALLAASAVSLLAATFLV